MMSAPAPSSAVARSCCSPDAHHVSSVPQCRNTTSVSTSGRTAATVGEEAGAVDREREPGWVSVADHASTSAGSSQSVALRMAMRWPLIVVRNGRYASAASWPIPVTGKPGVGDRGEGVLHARPGRSRARGCSPCSPRRRRRLQRGERRRRRAEVVVLPGDGFAAVGDRGLEVDHREVSFGEHGRNRIEHVLRVDAHLLGRAAARSVADRLRCPTPRGSSRPPRTRRSPPGRCRGVRSSSVPRRWARPWGAATVVGVDALVDRGAPATDEAFLPSSRRDTTKTATPMTMSNTRPAIVYRRTCWLTYSGARSNRSM